MAKPDSTSPGRTESFAALMILILLACISVAVYRAHLDFNPAVKLIVAKSLSRPDTGSAAAKDLKAIIALPDGIGVLSAGEVFQAHNLADKINGKAEFYLSAGFSRLNSQRVVSIRDSDLWAEVFVYHMTDAEAAFAAFSGQRREGSETLALSRHAYLADNAVFLASGSIYAEIIAPVVSPESRQMILALAESVIKLSPDITVESQTPSLFPTEGLKPDSIQLLASDVFGFQDLNSVYTADYRAGDSVLTVFVSRRSSPQEARALARAYGDFLVQFGGRAVPASSEFDQGAVIEIMDAYEVIFTNGVYLAGVHEAENRETAEQLANRLMHHLSGATDGS
jgi:hypothetical protein